MKRKLTILVLGAVLALVGIRAFTNGSGKRVGATTSVPVITQAGKLTMVPNPAGYAKMTLVVDLPRQATNSSAPAVER